MQRNIPAKTKNKLWFKLKTLEIREGTEFVVGVGTYIFHTGFKYRR